MGEFLKYTKPVLLVHAARMILTHYSFTGQPVQDDWQAAAKSVHKLLTYLVYIRTLKFILPLCMFFYVWGLSF
jgi:hypothetical protein